MCNIVICSNIMAIQTIPIFSRKGIPNLLTNLLRTVRNLNLLRTELTSNVINQLLRIRVQFGHVLIQISFAINLDGLVISVRNITTILSPFIISSSN